MAIATRIDHRNNFDFLRLLAASFVIVGHQFAIFGSATPGFLGSSISTNGIKIFFAISGYLIAQSWDRDPDVFRFSMRRALRIWPGFVVVCILTAFVLGPLVTTRTLRVYLADPATFGYVYNNALMYITYYLPGVFTNAPIVNAVNGSLWSIPSELFMYVVVCVVGLFFVVFKFAPPMAAILVWVLLFAVFIISGAALFPSYSTTPTIVYGTSLNATFEVGVYFVAGAVLWKCSDFHAPSIFLAPLAGIALFNLPLTALQVASPILYTYIVLAIGLSAAPVIKNIGRYGDVSYGLYLYAFPIQQLSYQLFGNSAGFYPALAFSFVVTAILAFASWHIVEKRALKLKPSIRRQPHFTPPTGSIQP